MLDYLNLIKVHMSIKIKMKLSMHSDVSGVPRMETELVGFLKSADRKVKEKADIGHSMLPIAKVNKHTHTHMHLYEYINTCIHNFPAASEPFCQ